MLIPYIHHVLNFPVEKIFLMRENYLQIFDEKVVWSEDISVAVESSDVIIVVKDDFVPVNSIEKIKINAEMTGKMCYIIQNPWTNSSAPDIIVEDYYQAQYAEHPSILNLSTGAVSQQIICEIVLNNLLCRNGINFKQIFSAKTKRFLLQLKECGILNESFERSLAQPDYYDLVVSSVDVGGSPYIIKHYFDLFKMISPDFVIFQTGAKFDGIAYIENFLSFLNKSGIDFYVKSHYYQLEDSSYAYCGIIPEEKTKVYPIDSLTLDKDLTFELLSKIAYPRGVVLL